MEKRCSLCGKTVRELAEAEIKERFNMESISISLKSELAYPYDLCDGCEDFLLTIVPAILEKEGIIAWDEKRGGYKSAIKK